LKLDDAELAFYDALETNEASVRELGDDVLRKIAMDLTENLRKNVTSRLVGKRDRQSAPTSDAEAYSAEIQISA
jgi:hypothetical protein